ncbi:hypothetical protein, partial [Treponema sp.]|uniref:hypothetical protein n=1 Tax=Treponema sp. TaxID=166 RepID=UPI00298E7E24
SDTAASAKKAPAEPDTDLDIAAILDQNVTHQDDDLEGVLLNMEELDRLFSSKPVDVSSSADTTPEEDGALDSGAGDTDESAAEETAGSVDIDEILNSQCCRNDALDEGFRPIDPDELDRLFSSAPVSLEEAAQIAASTDPTGAQEQNESTEQTDADLQEDKTEEKPKRKRRTSKKAKEENAQEDGENSENGDSAQSEEKPKRKRRSTKKAKDAAETEDAEVPSAKEPETKAPQTEEPRFLKMMKSLASHQMTLEEDENEVENVYGDLKELFVIADGVAPSTNDFSSHLVKFAKNVAKKYGFTKIYFFEDLPLDNPEFIYGLGSFGNLRNVLYACNKPCTDKIDENQKELIDATGLSIAEKKIHSVKEKIEDETNTKLHYPVKILVQDNYIEGLLYCAEKFREEHGIK